MQRLLFFIVLILQSIAGFGSNFSKCELVCINMGDNPYNITLLWEASYPAKDKNVTKELQFIEHYFKNIENAKVRLIVFSNEVITNQEFEIIGGNSQALQNILKNTSYDGFPVIPTSLLKEYKATERYLLFSNGVHYKEEIYLQFDKPVITVNSLKLANRARLHNLSYHTFGRFLDLNNISVAQAMEIIQPGNVILKKYVEAKEIISIKNVISGVVTDETGPLANVNIWLNKKSVGAFTNAKGRYSIIAKSGDIVTFSHPNKQTISVEIGTNKGLNVLLPSTIVSLETVLIIADKVQESELVTTAYGSKKREAVGVSVETVTADDIQTGSPNLTLALAGKFRGLRFEDHTNIASAIVREARVIPLGISNQRGSGGSVWGDEMTSQYPIFFYDGIPLPRYSKKNRIRHDFISPDNIKSVTVLKGLAATNRYGSMGSNGVILITSFTGDTDFVTSEKKKYVPPQLKKFSGSLSIEEDLEISKFGKLILDENDQPDFSRYLSFRDKNEENLAYYLETAKAFGKEGGTVSAARILSTIRAVFADNTSALRALAFTYTERANYSDALEVHERILEVSPTAIQNYSDLAIAQGRAGNHRDAIETFNGLMDGSVNNTLDFASHNDKNVVAFKQFLRRRNQQWFLGNVDKEYLSPVIFDLRIELDWTSYDARFKINIIKPNKDLLYWQHDEANDIELTEELTHGITSKQFNFFQAEKGTWYFNLDDVPAKALQNQNYLRVTVYTNFGKGNQTKISKILMIEPSRNGKTFMKVDLN